MSGTPSHVLTHEVQTESDGQSRAGGTPGGPALSVAHGTLASRGVGGVAPLEQGTWLLGREDGHAALTTAERSVSRAHATLRVAGSTVELRDEGSRNGTFVDGRPAPAERWVPLGDGSVIRCGSLIMVYRAAAPREAGEADPKLPGISPAMVTLRRQLEPLSRVRCPMLVLGETGTGKEFVARRLNPEGGPFVPVNCAELSRGVSRAELFGVVRGAYTDASTTRDGLVAAAEGGTLFLDEIGDLDPDVQAELVRFLETGRWRMVGASEERTSTARVVAATHVDLDAAMGEGWFRRDLLARLRADAPPIRLPPLRERVEDIPGWVARFNNEAIVRIGASALGWQPGFIETLLLQPWPDNLRGLRMALHAAILNAGPGARLDAGHLPQELDAHRRMLRGSQGPSVPSSGPGEDAGRAAPPDRAEIEDALTACRGVMRSAAERLGVGRRSLYRLCERHGIDPERFR